MKKTKTIFGKPAVTLINDERYYDIVNAYAMFKERLINGIGFSSWYKYFAKWRADNQLVPEQQNIAKVWKEEDMLRYVDYLNENVVPRTDGKPF